MSWFQQAAISSILLSAAVVAACGGGGGNAPLAEPPPQNPSTLNAMQLAFETSLQASGGGQHHLYAALQAAGLPAPPMHHAFALQYTLNDALAESPQKLGATPTPISPSLPLPDFSTWTPVRVLMEGRIVVEATLPNDADVRVRLHGDTARIDSMALDGTTIASATRVTSFEAFPLSGAFINAPAEVRNWPSLAPLSTNASLLKPNPTFLPGSGYFKRVVVRHGDTVFAHDCAGLATHDENVTPCPGAAALDVDTFPQVYAGLTAEQADGDIQTLAGVRAWVSKNPLPASVSPTEAHLVYFERNGAVYRGLLQRDGVVVRSVSASGAPLDYTLRFNKPAVDSLKAAVAG